MKAVLLASLALVSAAPAAAQVVHNSKPDSGWFFGTGNDYEPANSSVLTTASGDQLALRFHQTFVPAPASAAGVYYFALGTTPLSFDWSYTNANDIPVFGNLTLTNVGTGQTASYNPFFFINDNAVDGATQQNSFRFNWVNSGIPFLLEAQPGFFDPTKNSTYRVDFDITNASARAADASSLSITAVFGTGAAVVPEPGTWALLILGFGLVGGAMRRRTRASIAFA